jgi:pimeloyl-ACP methyl ester carboxylesterase
LNLFVGAASKYAGQDGWEAMQVCYDAAKLALVVIEEWGFNGEGEAILAGHSYGGAIVQVLSAILATRYPKLNVQTLTFGSPRPGDAAFARRMNNRNLLRIMADDDPIPRFPPHYDEAPLLYLSALGPIAAGYQRAVQPRAGQQLREDGSRKAANLPDLNVPIHEVTLLQWAVTPYAFSSARHAGYHYVRRLAKSIPVPPARPVVEAFNTVPENDQVIVKPDVQPPVVVEAAAQVIPFLEGESMTTYVAPKYLTSVQRVGDTFSVVWMDEVIGTSLTFSNAHTHSKHMNAWLRRLAASATVNQSALISALQKWLLVAQSGVKGLDTNIVVNP